VIHREVSGQRERHWHWLLWWRWLKRAAFRLWYYLPPGLAARTRTAHHLTAHHLPHHPVPHTHTRARAHTPRTMAPAHLTSRILLTTCLCAAADCHYICVVPCACLARARRPPLRPRAKTENRRGSGSRAPVGVGSSSGWAFFSFAARRLNFGLHKCDESGIQAGPGCG
jgi:hypothetical protein